VGQASRGPPEDITAVSVDRSGSAKVTMSFFITSQDVIQLTRVASRQLKMLR